MVEYRINMMNPKTQTAMLSINIPKAEVNEEFSILKSENYTLDTLFIDRVVALLDEATEVNESVFNTIVDYLTDKFKTELLTVEDVLDLIEEKATELFSISESVNKNSTCRCENPLFFITTVNIIENEKPVGYLGLYLGKDGNYEPAELFKTLVEAQEADGFDKIIPIYYNRPWKLL